MHDISTDGNISTYNNFLLDWMEITDCRPVAHVIQDFLFCDDFDGILLGNVFITAAVEDLLCLGGEKKGHHPFWYT